MSRVSSTLVQLLGLLAVISILSPARAGSPDLIRVRGFVIDNNGHAIKSAKVAPIGLQPDITTDTGQFSIDVAATRIGTPMTILVSAPGWPTVQWQGLIPRDPVSNPITIRLTRPRPAPGRKRGETIPSAKPPVIAPKGPSLPFDITHALVELNALEQKNALQCGQAHCLYLDVFLDGVPIFQKASDPDRDATKTVEISHGHHKIGARIGSRLVNLDPMGTCESEFELEHSTNLDLTIQPKIEPGPSAEPGVPRRLVWTSLCAVYAY
ncbi:MAG: hypothetical protein JWR80_8919 [Bradyrhizobium sp.]|nr:hypothetical protein [Bradyrhizobium sp.]